MRAENIKQIISGGENVTTEFKECIDKVSNSVYETVCSFLNHQGGTIFLGVKEHLERSKPMRAVYNTPHEASSLLCF